MNYAPQIIKTFKASAVERILVIDDAYNPPECDSQLSGDLLDILTAKRLRKHVSEDLLCEEDLDTAVMALSNNELDDDAITDAMATLYGVFLETRVAAVDPGGAFATAKGTALDALDPLLELLRRCGDDARVKTVGTGDAAIAEYRELKPNLILMDFYLSPPDRTTISITGEQEDRDRNRSIDLLKRMLSESADADPAVVLMSAAELTGSKEAAYLSRVADRVMALRFGYLHKAWVCGAGQALSASGEAADVLIDISSSFEFGRTLEAALKTWRTGAEAALPQLYRELRDFDVKDFAYLLRFRLYDEGESFADYLEWFLGESLRAIIDDNVEWGTDDFSRLDNKELTQAIEGAHPLPSVRIARFFHRMRFNSREKRRRGRFALGDLFVAPGDESVRMIISPDCDLVSRKEKRAAKRILTIGGKIRGLEEDRAFAGDLIFHNTPKAIQWNCKDLMTHEFGDMETLDVNGTAYSFFASMRPMSAQTIQKAALADLSRVGVAVPPTVNVGAPVKVYVKKRVDNQAKVVELQGLGEARAQVLMPRGGRETHKRVLFAQKFVRELVVRLEELGEDDLFPDHRPHRRDCIEKAASVRKAMLREGLALPGEGIFKIVTSVGEPRKRSWLEIVIDVSDEALIELDGTDPLDQEDEP